MYNDRMKLFHFSVNFFRKKLMINTFIGIIFFTHHLYQNQKLITDFIRTILNVSNLFVWLNNMYKYVIYIYIYV